MSRTVTPAHGMTKYTTTRVSVTQALVTPKNCADILQFIQTNKHLEEVELLHAYTTSSTCPHWFLDRLWKAVLQHETVKTVCLHNTNCLPSRPRCVPKRAVSRGSSLVELAITFCKIGMPCVEWLRANFAHNTGLQKLVLSDNGMCDEEIISLCAMFRSNQSITYLDISNNRFGMPAVRVVCSTLLAPASTNSITTLVCEGNQIGDTGAYALASALEDNTRLCMLNVENNRIGPSGIARLADMLMLNSTLNMLSLAKNSSNSNTQLRLHAALHHNTSLLSLDLSAMRDHTEMHLGSTDEYDDEYNAVDSPVDSAAVLRAGKCLQYLQVDNIYTSPACMLQIQQNLLQNTALQRISLVACGLSLSCVQVLAQAVGCSRSIRHLDLADNQLCRGTRTASRSRELGASFWNALARNRDLEFVSVRGNAIGTRSMWYAAEFVAQHTSLIELNVCNNGICRIGGLVMLHALAKNKSMQVLDLAGNASFPMSFSRLFSALIRKRICAQEGAGLHIHGIPLFVTARESRCFVASSKHRGMQVTKSDLLAIWSNDCVRRKEAFLLLTRPRLCSGLLATLCVDTLRMILSFDTLYG